MSVIKRLRHEEAGEATVFSKRAFSHFCQAKLPVRLCTSIPFDYPVRPGCLPYNHGFTFGYVSVHTHSWDFLRVPEALALS